MDFYVDPGALRSLASRFRAGADSVGAGAARLSGSAELRGDAFGLLPQALAAYGEYQRKLDNALDGLHGLQDSLLNVATNLVVTAANYEAADSLSVPR
jgi:hypothetical protein